MKNADMNDIMIEFSKSTATKAFAECKREVDVAAYLRTEFDREFGMTWNVIVGRHFGSDVSADRLGIQVPTPQHGSAWTGDARGETLHQLPDRPAFHPDLEVVTGTDPTPLVIDVVHRLLWPNM